MFKFPNAKPTEPSFTLKYYYMIGWRMRNGKMKRDEGSALKVDLAECRF